jgi:hypothetical protein
MPVKQQFNLWIVTCEFILACGLTCYCLFAVREVIKRFLSARLGYWLGIGFAVLMWCLPLWGSTIGLVAWVLHDHGASRNQVFGLGLSGFCCWAASFVFAGALLLEPTSNDRRPV